jgi:hypothetical protein
MDLRTAVRPSIEYYTYYELGGNARVEVSIDGGFTWTSNNMTGIIPNSYWVDSTWSMQYWNQRILNFSGAAPVRTDTVNTGNFSFAWSGAPATGLPTNDFSIRWTRRINIPVAGQIRFRTRTDDGVRLWVRRADGSDGYGDPNSGTGCTRWDTPTRVRSGAAFVPAPGGRRTPPDPFIPTCLIIDDWENQDATNEVDRLVTAGTYIIQMDMYDAGGDARAEFSMSFIGFQNPVYSDNDQMPGQISGTNDPARVPTDWERRMHDLTPYAGLPAVGLRFRLDRLGVGTASEGNNYKQESNQWYSPVDWEESWWIVDITIGG